MSGSETLTRLSGAALRYAQALDVDDVDALAERLYSFNRIPLTPRWRREFPGAGEVVRRLGLAGGAPLRALLEERWAPLARASVPGWLVWTNRNREGGAAAREPEYKLYVSPAVDELGRTLEAVVEVMRFSRARSFKIGADAGALLRPDKIVAHFSDLGDLASAAHGLAGKLGRVSAHGVPFTSEICGGGLLSWSVDPPEDRERASPGPTSWRGWVTRRAAAAVIAAKRDRRHETPPWRRALERLRSEGVDIERWVPAETQWRFTPG